MLPHSFFHLRQVLLGRSQLDTYLRTSTSAFFASTSSWEEFLALCRNCGVPSSSLTAQRHVLMAFLRSQLLLFPPQMRYVGMCSVAMVVLPCSGLTCADLCYAAVRRRSSWTRAGCSPWPRSSLTFFGIARRARSLTPARRVLPPLMLQHGSLLLSVSLCWSLWKKRDCSGRCPLAAAAHGNSSSRSWMPPIASCYPRRYQWYCHMKEESLC